MTTMPPQLWTYRARAERVVDGDTIDVVWDLSRQTHCTDRLRLLGLNCPEVHGPTREAGLASAAFTADWLRQAGAAEWPLILSTHKSDAFGRYLALVFRADTGACLNDELLAGGFAVPYMVGTP